MAVATQRRMQNGAPSADMATTPKPQSTGKYSDFTASNQLRYEGLAARNPLRCSLCGWPKAQVKTPTVEANVAFTRCGFHPMWLSSDVAFTR